MSDEDDLLEDDEAEPLPSELPTVDAANPKAVKRREKADARHKREAAEFWCRVFADPVGRREMWGLLSQMHPFEQKFACGPNGFPQPEATWFHSGEQQLGLRLYRSWLLLDRAGVLLMQDEHDPQFAKPNKRREG